MGFKNYFFIIILGVFLLGACKSTMVMVDQSSTDVVRFKFDRSKFEKAKALIANYEQKLDDDSLANETVLPGVEMDEVFADLKEMFNFPDSTIIGESGHYCSVAAILNWLLNNDPEKYTKAVIELAAKGKTRMGENAPLIKIPRALRKKVDYTIVDTVNYRVVRKDLETTSLSDFILGITLIHSEKSLQRIGLLHPKATYKKTCIGSYVTWTTGPWEMDDLLKRAGIKIEDKAYYFSDKENIAELKKIEKAVNDGKLPILFDNHWISYSRIKNKLYELTGAHYFTLHSMKIDEENDKVDFTYWDYGRVKNNPYLNRTVRARFGRNISRTIKKNKKFERSAKNVQVRSISIKKFHKAMKGYWIPEVE